RMPDHRQAIRNSSTAMPSKTFETRLFLFDWDWHSSHLGVVHCIRRDSVYRVESLANGNSLSKYRPRSKRQHIFPVLYTNIRLPEHKIQIVVFKQGLKQHTGWSGPVGARTRFLKASDAVPH